MCSDKYGDRFAFVLSARKETIFLFFGVANGPSKTIGLAKLSSNFMSIVVVFFSGYMRLAVSILFTSVKAVSQSRFLQG